VKNTTEVVLKKRATGYSTDQSALSLSLFVVKHGVDSGGNGSLLSGDRDIIRHGSL